MTTEAKKKYLSQEWLDEYRAMAQDQPHREGASFVIQYKITDGPDGEVDYYWVMKDGLMVEAQLGFAAEPDVTLTIAYENSVRLQEGTLAATTAFMQGKIRAKGQVKRLMSFLPVAASPEWKALDVKVRAMSAY